MFLVIDLIFSVTEQISGEHTERQRQRQIGSFSNTLWRLKIVGEGGRTNFLSVTMFSNGTQSAAATDADARCWYTLRYFWNFIQPLEYCNYICRQLTLSF